MSDYELLRLDLLETAGKIIGHYLPECPEGVKPLAIFMPAVVCRAVANIEMLSSYDSYQQYNDAYFNMKLGENLEMISIINQLG